MNIVNVLNNGLPKNVKIILLVIVAVLIVFALISASSFGQRRRIRNNQQKAQKRMMREQQREQAREQKAQNKKNSKKHKKSNNNQDGDVIMVEEEERERVLDAVVITKRSEVVNTQAGPVTIYFMGLRVQDGGRIEERISGSIYGTILVGDVVEIIYKGKQIEKITLMGHVDAEKITSMR